jgi:hypothetical protein
MLMRNLSSHETVGHSSLMELSDGLPTIAALARLCGRAIAGESIGTDQLPPEALALVVAGRGRGMFDIRGNKDAFETANRFLAVCVEIDDEKRLLFRDKSNPRQTMIYLDAFRQLCQAGFIIHHLLRDFSLSKAGFELADTLQFEDYRELIEFATEIEH